MVVQHLMSEETARIKCRDLVKKIAVYKSRLAVSYTQLTYLDANGRGPLANGYFSIEVVQSIIC